MAQDPFEALKKAPYPLFTAPPAYSFDLNEDMVNMLRKEFGADIIAAKFCEAVSGKAPSEIEKIGKKLFEDYGQKWMKRTMQISDEYPDRTIEMVMETVDRNGKQFLIWPHVPQRYVEVAYLSTQQFLKLPVTLNNAQELAYRVPQCLVFNTIKGKCGAEVANMMTCKNACLKALETIAKDMEMELLITMPAATAKDGFCEFSMKKL
jgi:hypothetical protein